MNEEMMKMMLARMINNRLQLMETVEQAEHLKELSTDVFEGLLLSIDERIKELEDTNNEN